MWPGRRSSRNSVDLPHGDWNASERSAACVPDRVVELRSSLAHAIANATALGCLTLNCLGETKIAGRACVNLWCAVPARGTGQ
jgi:hydroxypyruvate isomerase